MPDILSEKLKDSIKEATYSYDTACILIRDIESEIKARDKQAATEEIAGMMNSTKDNLTNRQIYHLKYSYEPLFENASDDEEFLVRNKYIRRMNRISQRALEELVLYTSYKKIVNDRESAIIGVDLMKQISMDNTAIWIESSNVSCYTSL